MLTFNPWLLLKIWAIVFCLKTGGGQKNSPFTPLPLPLRCKETIFQTYCLDVEVYYHSHYRHHIHPQRHLYHDQLQWDQIWKTNPTSFNSFILHHHRHHRHHQLHQHKDHPHRQEYPTSFVEAALTNQPQLSQQLFKQLFQPQCQVSWDFGISFEWVEIATQMLVMTQSRHQINQQHSLQLYSQSDRHGRRFATGEQQLCYSRTKTVFPKIARWVFKDGPLK